MQPAKISLLALLVLEASLVISTVAALLTARSTCGACCYCRTWRLLVPDSSDLGSGSVVLRGHGSLSSLGALPVGRRRR